MLKIDIGSGYNPANGFKTADITGYPQLDYIIENNRLYSRHSEVLPNSVNVFRLCNVIHHVKDIESFLTNLFMYLKPNGIIKIIDCNKDHYYSNVCLDNLWYRYVIPRKEIFISYIYRNYVKIAKDIGFHVMKRLIQNEKEITILHKSN